ncbi:MAG: hypothetical protein LBR05_10015 [Azoarcus sp.]|jgi:hypothetical protein|nr:hypothetical protein [Azoarcus sp.]
MEIDHIVSRLERVRRTGPDSWVACCPAHEDRHPSLSVCVRDDRILIHCFAGCDTADILHALGLDFGDLFADRPRQDYQPRLRQPFPAADALACLALAAKVVLCCAATLRAGEALSKEDFAALLTAASRFDAALDLMGLRHV